MFLISVVFFSQQLSKTYLSFASEVWDNGEHLNNTDVRDYLQR